MGEWGTGREGGRALDLWCQVSVPPILSPLVEPSCLQVRVGAWSKRPGSWTVLLAYLAAPGEESQYQLQVRGGRGSSLKSLLRFSRIWV